MKIKEALEDQKIEKTLASVLNLKTEDQANDLLQQANFKLGDYIELANILSDDQINRRKLYKLLQSSIEYKKVFDPVIRTSSIHEYFKANDLMKASLLKEHTALIQGILKTIDSYGPIDLLNESNNQLCYSKTLLEMQVELFLILEAKAKKPVKRNLIAKELKKNPPREVKEDSMQSPASTSAPMSQMNPGTQQNNPQTVQQNMRTQMDAFNKISNTPNAKITVQTDGNTSDANLLGLDQTDKNNPQAAIKVNGVTKIVPASTIAAKQL